MNWWGKLIGSGIGLLGGPMGALVGAAKVIYMMKTI